MQRLIIIQDNKIEFWADKDSEEYCAFFLHL